MLDGHEIKMLRTKLKETQSVFGARFKKGNVAVSQWESDTSKPPATTMAALEKLHDEQFDKSKVSDDNIPYLKGGGMGQSKPYTNLKNGQLENEAEKCRAIAIEYYSKLSPRAKAKIDIRAAAIIMTEYSNEMAAEDDNNY